MGNTMIAIKKEFKGQELRYFVPLELQKNKKCPLYRLEEVDIETADQDVLEYLLKTVGMKKHLTEIPDNRTNGD